MKHIINSISFILLGVLTMSCQKQNMHSGNSMQEQIASLPKEAINIEERNGLVLMREEEKMAHDVYSFLYDKWNIMIFNNIASSEQTHTNAVLELLDKYDIDWCV